MADWTAANDYLTLVQWNATLHTSEDSSLLIMGTGNEANAIIRTNKWVTDTTQYTTAVNFPPELGVHALGDYATMTYFDDLAFYVEGTPGTGPGTGFLPPVQQ